MLGQHNHAYLYFVSGKVLPKTVTRHLIGQHLRLNRDLQQPNTT